MAVELTTHGDLGLLQDRLVVQRRGLRTHTAPKAVTDSRPLFPFVSDVFYFRKKHPRVRPRREIADAYTNSHRNYMAPAPNFLFWGALSF